MDRWGPSRWIVAVLIVAVLIVGGLLAAGCSSGDDSGAGRTGPTSVTSAVPADVTAVLAVDGDKAAATVDERFQSYNIEMVEVTGGYFWPPYAAGGAKVFREPIDLGSERLRNLAKALGPAYIRVSGTWANSTYFDRDGTTTGAGTPEVKPPPGFQGVLTAAQWKGVGAFATAVDGKVVTSFASGDGVRDASGAWLPDQARSLLEFSKANGVPVDAAELFNEPNLGIGLPKGYTAQDFIRDSTTFRTMVDAVAPKLLVVGPGSADDVTPVVFEPPIRSTDMLAGIKPPYDRFSFHFYPKVSERCGSKEGPEVALTQEFLSRVDTDTAYYAQLRDRFAPGAGLWVTETAEAACGGDRWASTFRDVIRYVDTLGRLGAGDGNVVFHNTLAASDYGLLDEDGFVPRPDYWAAVLWSRLMGPKALEFRDADPGAGSRPADLAVYAHCTRGGRRPSVTYAVVNSSTTETRRVATGSSTATAYHLTGDLDSHDASLNGTVLTAHQDGTLPEMPGEKVTGGVVEVAPASVTFVVTPTDAKACT